MRTKSRFAVKMLAVFLSAVLVFGFFAGCDEAETEDPLNGAPTLRSIAVTEQPDTVRYYVGETFDPTGMIVTATMSDDTEKPVTGYTCSPSGALTEEDDTILISYTENGITAKTAIAIAVSAAKPVSIAITKQPDKTDYYAGESFDPTGMVVTATMEDGTTKTVTGYTCAPSDALMEGESAVTVIYAEGGVTVQTNVPITVSAVVLQKLEVEEQPNKVRGYLTGDRFDPTGTVLLAEYNSGKKETIQAEDFAEKGVVCSASGELHSGISSVTFSYGGMETAPVSIAVERRSNETVLPVLDTYVRSDSIYVTTSAPCDHTEHAGEEFVQYGDRAMNSAESLQVGFGTPGYGEYYLSAGYLVFELPTVKEEGLADVKSAVLQLWLQSAAANYSDARRTVKVVLADYDKITEASTYKNLEGTDGTVADAVTVTEISIGKTADTLYEIDLTSAIKNNVSGRNGKFVIGLINDEDRNLYADIKFYSSEAQDETKRPKLLINYQSVAPQGVAVPSQDITLAVGGQKELAASLSPWYAEGTITYKSMDEAVVTVSENGVLLGKEEGETTVTALCGGVSITVNVTVKAAASGEQTYYAAYSASSYAYSAFVGAAADDAIVYFNSHNSGWDAAAESRGFIWFDFSDFGCGTVARATAALYLSGSLPTASGTMQVEIYAAPGKKEDLFSADALAGSVVDLNAVSYNMTLITTRSFTWGEIALGQEVEIDLTEYINYYAPYLEDGMALILVTRDVSADNGLFFGGYTRFDGATDWRPRLTVEGEAA